MSRLLLLDGHSLAYRAFFALPPENFSTKSGQVTNAVYGFTSMLINVLRDEEPTHVAVAFDRSRKTFRSAMYAEYKATRSASPQEFTGQVELVKEVLDALRIVHLDAEGFEADDIIASLAIRAAEQGLDVLICSGDRDALQLVSDRVTLLYPRKGVSDMARMTPAAVEEKYNVAPGDYPDLAAMVGETSDNLPGVPGVGPKTAAKWIAAYGGLEGIVARAGEIPGKAGESLRAHLADVIRNRQVNQLRGDLELSLAVGDTLRQSWDREAVHTLFDSLEFRVLRDRLFATLEAAEPEVDSGFELKTTVLDTGMLGAWLRDHGSGRAGVNVTGVRSRGAGGAEAVAVATMDGHAAYLDLTLASPADEDELARWLLVQPPRVVMHDAKTELHLLSARGLPVPDLSMDTALAAYLVKPDQRSYDLADLSVRHLHRELRVEEAPGGQGMLDFSPSGDAAANAAMVRAKAVLDLADALAPGLDETGSTSLLAELELPLVGLLRAMEDTGVAVDTAGLTELEATFDAAVLAAQQEAHASIGDERVNLGSPKQLQEVLFDRLGLPKTRKTKTGYTTDADALATLYAQTEHPFLAALLRHRDASRLRVTVEGLLKSVGDDGRIHTTYQQTIAATGRLSSTDPNLQNIPIRTAEGRRIREAFVVGDGFESLMSADYSQIEMRIMAHLSGDEGLTEAFRSGEDLHRFVGSRVFGVDPDEVTNEMRSKVKAMSYGLAYGLSAFGLSKQLSISTGEAQGLMDGYFVRFGGVRDYLRAVVDEARATGFTETMLGRRRYLPDLTSDNRQRREMAERMALNAPIQGSAADVMKLAMLRVAEGLAEQGMGSRILLQVHDELVLEVAKGERDALEELVRQRMGRDVEGRLDMSVPLTVSVGVGHSWHEAAH